jgi:hypothetical protein
VPRKKTVTIELLHKIAKKNNGYCLSTKYNNLFEKLKWKCSEGHIWETKPINIIYNNSWCIECRKGKKGYSKKYTIEDMNIFAKSRGGKCLSEKYENSSSNLYWECKEGHRWHASYNNVSGLKGTWCPKCNINYGEEITRTYFNTVFGDKFSTAKPKWLSLNNRSKLELDGYSKKLGIAFEYQGEQHYKITRFSPNKEVLKNIKNNDHIKNKLCKKNNVYLFIVNYNDDLLDLPNIIKNQCIKFGLDVNKYNFNKKVDYNQIHFNKFNLDILRGIAKNKKGKLLSKLYISTHSKLEFECEKGHRWLAKPSRIKRGEWCPFCAKNQPLDIEEMKLLAAKKNGKFLSKKYVNTTTHYLWQCEYGHKWKATAKNIRKGRWCPDCFENNRGSSSRLTIEHAQKLAHLKEGKCLSKEYINSHTKLQWQCKFGHRWYTTYTNIKSGRWCPDCFENNRGSSSRLTIEHAQKLALLKEGKCLSKKYEKSSANLYWECKEGHRWYATYANINKGTWCPSCAGNTKTTLKVIQQIAQSKNVICLSKKYVNRLDKLHWKCKEGHRWQASYANVTRIKGIWCPICRKK